VAAFERIGNRWSIPGHSGVVRTPVQRTSLGWGQWLSTQLLLLHKFHGRSSCCELAAFRCQPCVANGASSASRASLVRRARASPAKAGRERQKYIDVLSLYRRSLQNKQCFHNLYAYLSAARNTDHPADDMRKRRDRGRCLNKCPSRGV
jgi:hypothetical protein